MSDQADITLEQSEIDMAKVIGPLNSSEARGAVGALTYNTWRGISTVKSRSGPVTTQSDDQIALRTLTKLATVSWQSITDAQRATWRDYANEHLQIDWTGNPKRLTGYNWYVRINVRRQLLGQAIASTPPTHEVTHSIKNLRASWSIIWLAIAWDSQGAYVPATLNYEFYVVGPHSAGASPSVKMADRKAYIDYSALTWTWMPPASGLYTFFVRPIHSNGTVGVFQKCSATKP